MMRDFDYQGLGELGDDVLLLEWDIAVDRDELAAFEDRCRRHPYRVRVAPYKLYHVPGEPWAHRHVDDQGGERWVLEYEETCDYFGFGMIYLPHMLIRRFESSPAPARGLPIGVELEHYADRRFTDQTFSCWHRRQGYDPVRIDWDVRPVHLHW